MSFWKPRQGDWDYLANCVDEQQLSVPDGFDAEVFRAGTATRCRNARLPSEREHVTPWFRSDGAGCAGDIFDIARALLPRHC